MRRRLRVLLIILGISVILLTGILIPKLVKDQSTGYKRGDLACSKVAAYIALDHPLERLLLHFGDLKIAGVNGENVRVAALTWFGIKFAEVQVVPPCEAVTVIRS